VARLSWFTQLTVQLLAIERELDANRFEIAFEREELQ
jgi:hypothetical protein